MVRRVTRQTLQQATPAKAAEAAEATCGVRPAAHGDKVAWRT